MTQDITNLKQVIGKTFISQGRTIGEGEFSLIQSLTWNTDAIHSDREYMKSTGFGERVMVGACVLACVWGLEERSGFFPEMYRWVRNMVAVEYDEVHFARPFFPGDTLKVHTVLKEARSSTKKPERLILKRQITAFNQHNEEVATCIVTSLADLINT